MNNSFETEAAFESRTAFGEYGKAALLMMIDKGSGGTDPDEGLPNAEFEEKYGVEKSDVNFALIRLQMALEDNDFVLRNEVYDFFVALLKGKFL